MGKFDALSREELLRIAMEQDKKLRKRYGLIWDSEREPEEVVLRCRDHLPVLDRVKGKSITTKGDAGSDHILIEGDNFHALNVLSYTHREKVDVIYIDPPYNTGNKDFIYNDRYVDKEDEFRHSKWLSFMEKRLRLAQDLLKKTGVIFISIDDNEVAQLKLLCDEVFGEENFIANLVWRKKYGGGKGARFFVDLHEYILVYAKDISQLGDFLLERSDKQIKIFKEKDDFYNERGLYYVRPLKSGLALRKTLIYPIDCPDGSQVTTQWICGRDTFKQWKDEGRIVFKKLRSGKYNVYKKFYKKDGGGLVHPESILYDLAYNQNGKEEIKELFNIKEGRDIPFENPKARKLIQHLLVVTGNKNAVILDFMAGSGTTGHAVLELNKEDGGNRQFILCTNNELNGSERILREQGLPEKEIQEHGICRRVTYPRLQKVSQGYKNAKGERVPGLGGNMQYFKTAFVKRANSRDQLKYDLTHRCTEMLCVKEGMYEKVSDTGSHKIFSNRERTAFLCVYYALEEASTFALFIDEIKKLTGEKRAYVFSLSGKTEKARFAGVKNVSIQDVPQEILDIYARIVRKHIPSHPNVIRIEMEKAKELLEKAKNKDDSARNIRVALEKTLERIITMHNITIANRRGGNRIGVLIDALVGARVFTRTEGKSCEHALTVGNASAHGSYDEYEYKDVLRAYETVSGIITRFLVG